MPATRTTVDLSQYPDLVVIYLGMRVRSLRGLWTVLAFGPRIKAAVDARPDGLLLHEDLFFSFFPPHVGMRQYWRDFDALETWARTSPHAEWWRKFLRDPAGTGFWHETHFLRGGMESVYVNMTVPVGLTQFAPTQPARGPMFSARTRAARAGEPRLPEPLPESEYYRT